MIREEIGIESQLSWIKNFNFNLKELALEEIVMNWFVVSGDFLYFSPFTPMRVDEERRMIPILKIENLCITCCDQELNLLSQTSRKYYFLQLKMMDSQKVYKIAFLNKFNRNHFGRVLGSVNFLNSIKKNTIFPLYSLPSSFTSNSAFYFLVLKKTNLPKILIKSIISNYIFSELWKEEWFKYYPLI